MPINREVFWRPTLGVFQILLGRSEESELQRLALAVSQALDSLPGLKEQRWYAAYGDNVGPDAIFTHRPQLP